MKKITIDEVQNVQHAYELIDFLKTKCEDERELNNIVSCPSFCFDISMSFVGTEIDVSFCVGAEIRSGEVNASIDMNCINFKGEWSICRGITLGNILVALSDAAMAYYNDMFVFACRRHD